MIGNVGLISGREIFEDHNDYIILGDIDEKGMVPYSLVSKVALAFAYESCLKENPSESELNLLSFGEQHVNWIRGIVKKKHAKRVSPETRAYIGMFLDMVGKRELGEDVSRLVKMCK